MRRRTTREVEMRAGMGMRLKKNEAGIIKGMEMRMGKVIWMGPDMDMDIKRVYGDCDKDNVKDGNDVREIHSDEDDQGHRVDD